MGGITGDISLNYASIMFRNIRIHGRFMYERADIAYMIKMVSTGVLRLQKDTKVEKFSLEGWAEAFRAAEKSTTTGVQILLAP